MGTLADPTPGFDYADFGHLYSPTAGTTVVPNSRELLERAMGKPLDSSFYDEKSPDYAANMALQRQINEAVLLGGQLDTRDWAAIMQADNPLQAALSGLKDMYANPEWQQKNFDLQTKGFGKDPAGVYFGYADLANKYGFDYSPTPEALAGITYILSDPSWKTKPAGKLGEYWDMARLPLGQRPFDKFDLSKLAPLSQELMWKPPRYKTQAPVTMPYNYKPGGRVRLI